MSAERLNSLVQIATEVSYSLSILRNLLLLPAISHCFDQCYESDGAADQHVLLQGVFQQMWIDAQCSREYCFSWDKHYYEVGVDRERVPILLRAKRRYVRTKELCMVCQVLLPPTFICRFDCVEIAV